MRITVIEKLRIDKGMSRVDLASAAKVSEKSLINYEARYAKRSPRPLFKRTQERIAAALGVDVKVLFKQDVPR